MSDLPSRIAGAQINFMDRDRVMSEMVEVRLSEIELGPKADADLDFRFHETAEAEVVRIPAPTAGEDRAPHRGSTEEGAAYAALTQRKED